MKHKGIQDKDDNKRNKHSQKQHGIAPASDTLQQVQWLM
jgi:hypothetical protein